MIPLKTRRNLVLLVVLGWGVDAVNIDCDEYIGAVSVQKTELDVS